MMLIVQIQKSGLEVGRRGQEKENQQNQYAQGKEQLRIFFQKKISIKVASK